MRRIGVVIWFICAFAVAKAQIVADHTVVDQYDDIPEQYMDSVRSMLASFPGESHSVGYRLGQELLERLDSRFQVETYVGSPPSPTTQRLRTGMHRYGGEYLFFNTSYTPKLRAEMDAQNASGNPFDVMGFGWCYDMTEDNPPGGTEDPVYQVRWAGRSEEGPDGNRRWGLDSGDQALTGNRVNMDTYLQWVEDMIQYCTDNSYPITWVFTTGPVDNPAEEGNENGFQREIKHDYIRDYVAADATRILFDYADILCWSNGGEQNIVDWNDGGTIRPHAHIHPQNTLDYNSSWNLIPPTEDGDHIGEVGALRLGKAMWWMLARIAGWQNVFAVSDIQIYATGDTSVVTGQELQLLTTVLPENATNKEIAWSVIQGSGTATISQGGLLRGGFPGMVEVVATALDGSGVADTLSVPILDPLIAVVDISITSAGGITEIYEGGTLQCFASVLPEEASNTAVLWSIVNQSGSASISEDGLVTGLTQGTVEVIATAEDGSQVADTLALSITEVLYVTDITISSAGGVTEVVSGEALQFSAEVLPVNASNPEVVWSVINGTGTATITTDGLLIAGDPGSVEIMAAAQDGSGVEDTFTLDITPAIVLVESISISSAGGVTSLESGYTLQFSAEVLPVNASNPEVTWSVINDVGSASITAGGLLTAGNPGTVTVVATAVDGTGVEDTFILNITPPPVLVERITISSAGGINSLESGSTLQFSAEVLPAEASNKSVEWSVSNGTGTADITAGGLLVAGIPGTVQVIATAMDGSGVYDAFSVSITPPQVPVTSIVISAAGGITTLKSGQTLQFSASIFPENASNKNIRWSVSAITGTASISAQGLLTAGSPGEVWVVASAQDGSGVASIYILTILPGVIEVLSIEVHSAGDVSVVEEGDMLQLYATVNPSNADNKEVFWHVSSSSGNAVGSITASGTFIALGEGEVDALAIAQDGSGVYDALRLTVVGGPSGEESYEQEDINLYPNPGAGLFYLQVGDLQAERLMVIDMHGAVVLEHIPEPGIRLIELDLSRQQPGIYYVQIITDRESVVKALIISR